MGEGVDGEIPAVAELTDGIVLTEPTGERAVTEEEGGRAVCATEGWLFPVVYGRAGQAGILLGAAGTGFPIESSRAAVPGTEAAVLEQALDFADACRSGSLGL